MTARICGCAMIFNDLGQDVAAICMLWEQGVKAMFNGKSGASIDVTEIPRSFLVPASVFPDGYIVLRST
jgi:hypothetical protein